MKKSCRFLLTFEKDVRSMLEGIGSSDHPFSGQDVDASSLGWAISARAMGEKFLEELIGALSLSLIIVCQIMGCDIKKWTITIVKL